MLILLIVLTGIMAGVYFAFSAFIMRALNELPSLQAGQAMNKVNDVILNTIFLPIFFVSSLWYAGLLVWEFMHWQAIQSWLMILAAVFYLVGMFAVTAFGNVPLNNKLQQSAKNDSDLSNYWQEYHHSWTKLNHIRTLSCIAACALLTLAITPN